MPPEVSGLLQSVLYSGQIASGPNVERFEDGFGQYLGNPRVTATGDISSTLALAMAASGVGPGDEVIASPMTCLATVMPVLNLGARVSWCDIERESGSLDPLGVERCITEKSKALLVYHWAGNPVDLEPLVSVASRFGLRVIEDAGEALGAEYHGRKIGNCGIDFTAFSFYANRQITTGEGAALAFGRKDDFERCRWFKRYSIHQPSFRDELGEISRESDIPEQGFNSYLNHIGATIGMAQLPYLEGIVDRHHANGAYYDERLRSIPGITLLKRPLNSRSAFWVYTLYAERRDDLLKHLRGRGIYASKVHLRNDIYTCFGAASRELAGVEYFDTHALSIPSGWWVSNDDREYVVMALEMGW